MRVRLGGAAFATLLASVSLAACGDGAPACTTPAELLRCDERTLNIAPRGGQFARPEHTFLAYDHAFEVGADGLELDVQATSDGVLVVMFDETIDRTTNGTGLLKETTFEALRSYDAGWSFSPDQGSTFPYRGMGVTVPTLAEVLERYPDSPLFVEARQSDPPFIDSLIEVIRAWEATSRVVVTAFDDVGLAEIREKAPEIATTMGPSEVIAFLAVSNQSEPDPSYQPPADFLLVPFALVDATFVPTARLFGLRTYPFTVNSPADMTSLIEAGVDGLLTDDPELLSEVIRTRSGSL